MPKDILRKYDCEFINLTNKSLKNEKFIDEIITICESYLQKGFKLQNELKGSLKNIYEICYYSISKMLREIKTK